MSTVLIAGAGQVGSAIAHLMVAHTNHKVVLVDQKIDHITPDLKQHSKIHTVQANIEDQESLAKLLKLHKANAVVSCLPYYLNHAMAQLASDCKVHYFDLTEDIKVTESVRKLSHGQAQAFVPQCGLAPGFINIAANHLMQHFEELDTVKLRCGGLPINSSNELKYAFTWSVDGLINEYIQPCLAIENRRQTHLSPLANLEHIQIDGLNYEAFNTSGGIGSLTATYEGKVDILNYKTIRYPGHRDKMKLLIQDLKLGKDPEILKKILINAIPHTREDVVIFFISVLGKKENKLQRESFVTKYYPRKVDNIQYSALQLITAASASAVINIILNNPDNFHGYIPQERFSLNDVLATSFGQYLEEVNHGKHSNGNEHKDRKFWNKLWPGSLGKS